MCPRIPLFGGFALPTYGLLVGLGFLVGLSIVSRLAKRRGLDGEKVSNLGVYIAISALLGAKLLMILINFKTYAADPSRIFSLSTLQAGGVFYGGLIGALLVSFWYMRKEQLPVLATADVFVPGLAIGHAIGRLGCFAAGCCWGAETDVPWAVVFTDPAARDFVGVPLGIHLHPSQLYESLGTALVGFFLLWRFQRPHRPGVLLGYYLALWSTFRLFVEFTRDNASRVHPLDGPLTTTQWVAIALIVAGIYLLTRRAEHTPEALEQPT